METARTGILEKQIGFDVELHFAIRANYVCAFMGWRACIWLDGISLFVETKA